MSIEFDLKEFKLDNFIKLINIDNITKKNIYNHNWIDGNKAEPTIISIYCSKCNVNFYKVINREWSNGVKWNELTCNEILIKNLLE